MFVDLLSSKVGLSTTVQCAAVVEEIKQVSHKTNVSGVRSETRLGDDDKKTKRQKDKKTKRQKDKKTKRQKDKKMGKVFDVLSLFDLLSELTSC